MFPRKLFWIAIFAALFVSGQGTDRPIIIRDGSIKIKPEAGNLSEWTKSNPKMLAHPDQNGSLAKVEVTGPGAQDESCSGRGRCVVEFQWSTGEYVRIISTQGGKGLNIETSVDFDDAKWNKKSAEWSYPLPKGAKPTVTIADRETDGTPKVICQGKGCKVRIHYQ